MKNLEKIINEWKYIIKHTGATEYSFDIIPPKDKVKPKPESLYKYYSLKEYSINSLENCFLFAAHPYQFNDLWDCHFNLVDVTNFANKHPLLFNQFCKEHLLDITESGTDISVNEYENIKRFLFDFTYNTFGLVSLTNNPKDILMWAYYSNNRGFCVEYDYKKFPFKFHGPFQINYSSVFSPIELILEDLFINVIYSSFQKNNIWKHEDEWRMLIQHEDETQIESPFYKKDETNSFRERNFYFDINCIKRIIVGRHFLDYFNNNVSIEKGKGVVIKENSTEEQCRLFDLKRRFIKFVSKNKIRTCIILPIQDSNPSIKEFQYGEKELEFWLNENETDRFYFKINED